MHSAKNPNYAESALFNANHFARRMKVAPRDSGLTDIVWTHVPIPILDVSPLMIVPNCSRHYSVVPGVKTASEIGIRGHTRALWTMSVESGKIRSHFYQHFSALLESSRTFPFRVAIETAHLVR